MRLALLASALLSVVALGLSPLTSNAASNDVSPIRSVYLRPPAGAPRDQPLQVLIALHGMGGDGQTFAQPLIEQADSNGWLIVAPTIAYGDWTDANQVAREDPLLIRSLLEYVDSIPQRSGYQVRSEVLLLGHSRGAQLAHRFAEFRPDRVLGVAALSAGTYTLPASGMSFPFGMKGLAFDAGRFDDVPFWLGVGGEDTNPADLPHQWDKLEGSTRVQRAQSFEAALHDLGVHAVLRVFGGATHDLTSEMRTSAMSFLQHVATCSRAESLGRLSASAIPL